LSIATPKDRRSRIVELTAAGRRLIERASQKHANDTEETMAMLKTTERTELVRLLKKVGLWAASRLDDSGDTAWLYNDLDPNPSRYEQILVLFR
jgi:hypothetical protein